MVINKKLLRGSRSVKLRLIGSLLIIVLSVALMVSFSLSMKSVSQWLDVFRENCAVHDIRVKTLKTIEQLDNADFEARYTLDANLSGDRILHISSLTERIDLALITDGSAISHSGEILLDSLFANSNDISVGDKLEILGRNFTVCGFYTSPDTVLPAKSAESIMVSSDSFGLAAMSESDLKALGGYETEYLIKLKTNDNDTMNEVLMNLNEKYVLTECKKAVEDNRVTYIDGDLKLFSEDFQVLPTIFIVIASFACSAVVARIMKSETVQMGVLYSFGYRRSTLCFHYMLYPLIISVGGVILGCAAGVALSQGIASILEMRYLLPEFRINIYAETIIKAALMPICFMAVICMVFILMTLLHSPLELIRDEKESSKISAFSHIKLNGFSFAARFRIRTLLRNIPRELFLVAGIALSSTLILIYVSMISSMSDVLNKSFGEILQYEYMYTFTIPQNTYYGENCYINSIHVTLDGDYIDISGTSDETSMMNYTNVDGSKTSFSENVITNNMAAKYGINEGDTVTVTNSLTGEDYEIQIDKICVSYVENFISIPLDRFNEMTHQPQGSYVIIASADALDIKESENLTTVETIDANRKAVNETILPLNILLVIMLIFATVVAFIIIIIVTSVIIEENKSTISLMKVFGYEENRIASLVIDLNAIVAVLGFFLSIPLTLRISGSVFAFMSDTLGMYIPARLSVVSCVTEFIVKMGVFLIAKLIMQRKIFSASAADALKARE